MAAAATPNLDRLAASGEIGLSRTIPPGYPPGSDVANLSVMGYDPHVYYTGRAPLEAASLGIELEEQDIAFRCNLVWIEGGIMKDFSAGHISTAEAEQLVIFIQEQLLDTGARFHPGLSYRHIMVSRETAAGAACTPPHDITGKPIEGHLPRGDGAGWLQELMDASSKFLPEHPVNVERVSQGKAPANMIWLWGQGKAPQMPTLGQRFSLSGSVISAVDLVKGLGKYAGLEIIDVPGATGFLDTDYGAKARYSLMELQKKDFVYVHVEAPDEASHMGDVEAKLTAIERFDAQLVGLLLDGLKAAGPHRILVMPDHATPLEIRTHTDEPVPYLIFDSTATAAVPGRGLHGTVFDEMSAAASGRSFDQGWMLMEYFLGIKTDQK